MREPSDEGQHAEAVSKVVMYEEALLEAEAQGAQNAPSARLASSQAEIALLRDRLADAVDQNECLSQRLSTQDQQIKDMDAELGTLAALQERLPWSPGVSIVMFHCSV